MAWMSSADREPLVAWPVLMGTDGGLFSAYSFAVDVAMGPGGGLEVAAAAAAARCLAAIDMKSRVTPPASFLAASLGCIGGATAVYFFSGRARTPARVVAPPSLEASTGSFSSGSS